MSSEAISILHSAIGAAAKPAGFKKKGSSWYCQEPASILVINPQKSQYGLQFFLNLGVYFRQLGEKVAPREEECHLRGRITGVLPEDVWSNVEGALDFESDKVEREAILGHALVEYAIPFLKGCATQEGVVQKYKAGKLDRFLTVKALREKFELY